MGDLRKHLRSKKYREQVDTINADLVYIDGLGADGDAAAEHSAAVLHSYHAAADDTGLFDARASNEAVHTRIIPSPTHI